MVRTWPMRAERREETICEIAPNTPVAKKIAPAVWTGSEKRRKSHSARSDWTANPPPKASRLKRAASCSTTRRERASGRARGGGGGSTAAESRRDRWRVHQPQAALAETPDR